MKTASRARAGIKATGGGLRVAALGLGCVLLGTAVAGEIPLPEGRRVTEDGRLLPLDAETRQVAERARETLAAELQVDAAMIEVDTVRAMQWSDTSLGCPQPGYSYGQVITPGFRVTLRADGVLHFVHTGRTGTGIVCKRKQTPGGIPSADGEVPWAPQATAARKDLARRLAVPVDQVRVAYVRGNTWEDRSLDCPEPDVTYQPESVKGYIMRLRVGSRDYTYHTDLQRTVACPPIATD